MPVIFVVAFASPVAQHYRQRRAWKYLFLPLYGNTENLLVTVQMRAPGWPALINHSEKGKSDYTSCSVLSNNLQNDLSKRLACQALLHSLQ